MTACACITIQLSVVHTVKYTSVWFLFYLSSHVQCLLIGLATAFPVEREPKFFYTAIVIMHRFLLAPSRLGLGLPVSLRLCSCLPLTITHDTG